MAEPKPQPTAAPPTVRQVADGATAATAAPGAGLAVGGAAGAGAAGATYVAAGVAAVAGEAAVARASRAVLSAFARFLRRRSLADFDLMVDALLLAYPGQATPAVISDLRQREAGYEREFQRKALARWRLSLPKIMGIRDPQERTETLRKFRERELGLVQARVRAMTERGQAGIEHYYLRTLSPQGAYWKLSPHVQAHTLDCLVMGEKFWPWEVLDEIHPPLHHGCPCSLWGLDEAINAGLMHLRDIPDTKEAVARAKREMARARKLMEALTDEQWQGYLVELLVESTGDLQEADLADLSPQLRRELGDVVEHFPLPPKLLHEADYREVLHPRGRGGEWIKKLALQIKPSVDRAPTASEKVEAKNWEAPPPPVGKKGESKGGHGYSSDVAYGTNTALGRVGEEAFVRIVGGRILHPEGHGEQSPLDVHYDGYGFEVKAVSTKTLAYKATPKPYEIEQKQEFAEHLGVQGAIAIVVVDSDTNTAHVYYRDSLRGGRLARSTGWQYLGSGPLTEGEQAVHGRLQEASIWQEALHPRDRIGQWADLPTGTRIGSMNARQVTKLLKKHGFKHKRQRGSHAVYQHPAGGQPVIVPMHGGGALKRGTMMNVLGSAGLLQAAADEGWLDLQEDWREHLHPRNRLGMFRRVIAIDGPAASGKSTVARTLAHGLGATYIDTGALFRAAGLAQLRGDDPVAALRSGRIVPDGSTVRYGNEDVSAAIRTAAVDRAAAELGGDMDLRDAVAEAINRRVDQGGLFVADGRDAGNSLFAEHRIYLTADLDTRAQRRADARGLTHDQAKVAITERDALDAPRLDQALVGADAVVDNTDDPDGTVTAQRIAALVDDQEALVANDQRHQEWMDLIALGEAEFTAALHPRDRLGRWVRSLGFKAYRVGGAVRDPLIGKQPKDVDFMVMAAPEAIKAAVEAHGGTVDDLIVRDRLVGVRAHVPGLTPPEGVEIAPPRIEKAVPPVVAPAGDAAPSRSRHDFVIEPHPGVYGSDLNDPAARTAMLEADAKRRDFTANALYQDEDTGDVIDPTGTGLPDLRTGLLRTPSKDSFQEDSLRMLRATRFMSEHGFDLHPDTEAQMREHAPHLDMLTQGGVSGTARTELNKTLMGDNVGAALRKMRDTGVLAQFLPELAPTIGFDQQSKYHDLPLDEHIISVVEGLAKDNAPLEVRLAALFHDAGKPETAWRGDDGNLHFYARPAGFERRGTTTGVSQVDEAISAYQERGTFRDVEGEEWPLTMLDHPAEAAGECSNVSRDFAEFLRARGIDAFDSGDKVEHGGTADRPDNPLKGTAHDADAFGYMDRSREDPLYPEHSATVVRTGDRTFIVDWAAAQFGYDQKPLVTEVTGPKEDHAVAGARIAREALERLNYPRDTIDRVTRIVQHHMVNPNMTSPATIRRWRRSVGPDLVDDLIAHRRADFSAKGEEPDPAHLEGMDRFAELARQERNAPTTYRDIAIGGDDLIALGMEPGPEMGALLRELTDAVLEDPTLNEREALLGLAREKLDLRPVATTLPENMQMAQHRFNAAGIPMNPPVRSSQWSRREQRAVADTIIEAVDRYSVIREGVRPLTRVLRTTGNDPIENQLADRMGASTPLAVVTSPIRKDQWLAMNDAFENRLPGRDASEILSPATASGLDGAAWHEVGHLLSNAAGIDNSRLPMEEREAQHVEAMDHFGIGYWDVSGLSTYAESSPLEAFAELSAMYHTPGFAEQLDPEIREAAEHMFEAIKDGWRYEDA